MSDDKDKFLKNIGRVADRMVEAHKDHGCAFEAIGVVVGEGARMALAGGSGPAQVSTAAYRESWDVTFGGKPAVRGRA